MFSVLSPQRNRRRLAALTVAAALGITIAGCGSGGPSQTSGATATMWSLTSGDQPVIKDAVAQWNEKNPDRKITVEFFASDAYKAKIRTAVGAGQAPTLIFNWTGGVLQSYVDNKAVEDLSDLVKEKPDVADRYLPSVLQNGVIDGKTYALPMNKVNPATMYFNKDLLDKAGIEPPKTWDDIMAAVPKLKAIGVAPFALGGQTKWPELIWLEFLVDREGGSGVWERIQKGEPDAWSDPAVLDALKKIQQLVDAGGFQDSFASTASNSGSELALLYTGKAAMCLQLSSQFQAIKQGSPDFIANDKLGYAPFPTIDGGKGDPSYTVGSPANFFSVSSTASEAQKKTAKDFLASGLFNDSYTEGIIKTGAVPPLKGVDSKLGTAPDSEFLKYTYDQAANASTFQFSWDQAVDPSLADTLLTHLSQVFLKQETPEQFVDAMNAASKK
ncbi:sugar ABC transporter substrate-binding protein [Arthrobacter sp. MYb23]|uniref:ABC transporter substrate-binding protein n=1 Tax=unclassified Arthrobacter TaxID=235627 RepID=UPI000CFABE33|nr:MULTISPECIES: extracellular solute-binding protein [unclassified Arthrobacter]PRB43469.1 sugar ABC transporter substrate-binding protein [Arthrobacter sp. MYb51]PRB93713.1 sugar ABC transporter substrate-binding protein [Arthrobacter sp. MYb23]